LLSTFPHVRAFHSYYGPGVHLLASRHPIVIPTAEEWTARLSGKAEMDLLEWDPQASSTMIYRVIFSREIPVTDLVSADPKAIISDDRPFNEYFLLRRLGRWLKDRRPVPVFR
jgi:hypothetical protein